MAKNAWVGPAVAGIAGVGIGYWLGKRQHPAGVAMFGTPHYRRPTTQTPARRPARTTPPTPVAPGTSALASPTLNPALQQVAYAVLPLVVQAFHFAPMGTSGWGSTCQAWLSSSSEIQVDMLYRALTWTGSMSLIGNYSLDQVAVAVSQVCQGVLAPAGQSVGAWAGAVAGTWSAVPPDLAMGTGQTMPSPMYVDRPLEVIDAYGRAWLVPAGQAYGGPTYGGRPTGGSGSSPWNLYLPSQLSVPWMARFRPAPVAQRPVGLTGGLGVVTRYAPRAFR